MGFSRQEHWSGWPFPPPGGLPDPGVEPTSPASPAVAGRFFTTEPPGKLLQPREPAAFLGRRWQAKAARQPLGGQGRVVKPPLGPGRVAGAQCLTAAMSLRHWLGWRSPSSLCMWAYPWRHRINAFVKAKKRCREERGPRTELGRPGKSSSFPSVFGSEAITTADIATVSRLPMCCSLSLEEMHKSF